jgi:hypothetical protein
VVLLLVALSAVACGDSLQALPQADAGPPGQSDGSSASDAASPADGPSDKKDGTPPWGSQFTPKPVPELNNTPPATDQPVYFFLFAHTEDQFNHEVSEERYLRLAPEVAALSTAHPEAHVVWTIMFQGADAETVAQRNPTTGVVDLLKGYAKQGVVEFGYHAHHDPTYNNRPQNSFTANSTWEELVTGMDQWVSCKKHPTQGGCLAPTGGGIQAILDNFGAVGAVSGLYTFTNSANEGGSGRHALTKYLPKRIVGFGFPDHGGSVQDMAFVTNRDALLVLMEPSIETTGSVFWIDDAIRINDGDILAKAKLSLRQGPAESAQKNLPLLERKRPNFMNAGFGDKYIYCPDKTSPTKWGYANPMSPELTTLKSESEIESNYQQSIASLKYLVETWLPQNPGSRFVGSKEVEQLFAPAEYWTVTKERLDVVARWLLLKWGSAPPSYASDGSEFYSLRDSFLLLANALAQTGFPAQQQLTLAYGPLSAIDASKEVTLQAADVRKLAKSLATSLAPPTTWQTTPANMLAGSYEVGGTQVSAAQLLYAMALLYASTYAGTPLDQLKTPASSGMPETLQYLTGMGCPRCEGTAWSMKPAKVHSLN